MVRGRTGPAGQPGKRRNKKLLKIKGVAYRNRKEYWNSKKTHKFDINDTFYKENFMTPRDEITQRYRAVMQTPYYKQILPDIIQQGLANLQEKEAYKQLNVPLFSLIKSGGYEKDYANYDVDNTKDNINFFLNNLPSFKKYKKDDELDWIIEQHRLLALEIFEYYAKNEKGVSVSTLGARFNIILRVMRIAYENKKAPIYKLFSTIVFALKEVVTKKEGENQLNQHEKKKYIHWKDVLCIQDTMEKEFASIKNKMTQSAYDLNNDLVLISLYSLFPPERNEIKFLEFSRHPRKNDKDYIYVSKNMDRVVLKFNDIKKQHEPIQFDLSKGEYKNERLSKIIIETLSLYPRDYVFTLKKKYPNVDSKVTKRGLDERLYTIFQKYGIKNKVSVNSLRSSYISYILSKKGTKYNDKLALAERMRTSLHCLELYYNKVKTIKPILDCNNLHKTNENDSSDTSDESYESDSSYKSARSHNSDSSRISDVLDNLDFSQTSNKSDKSDSSSKSDKSDSSNKSDKSDSSSKSDKSDSSNKSDKSDKNTTNKGMVDCIVKCCQKNKNVTKNAERHVDEESNKVATQYKRKLLKAKEWYIKNREDVIERTREYKDRMTPFEKTRERICQLLNASPDYAQKIRERTKQKYNFYYDNNIKRWTWEGRN
jgi:hypothetical protein